MLEQPNSFGLAAQLSQLQSRLFRGRLDIESSSQINWSLYFYLGRLVWAGGGAYPVERWQRLLNYYCSEEAAPEEIAVETSRFFGYATLLKIISQDRRKRSSIINLVQDNLVEVLFDILQYEHQLKNKPQNLQLTFTYDALDYPKTAFTLMRVDQVFTQAQQNWQEWQQEQLTSYSPNLVPVIQQPERLKQNLKNSLDEYLILTKFVDGKRTIRSVALELQQSLLNLTSFLVEYVNSGMMSFIELQTVKENNAENQKEERLEQEQNLKLLLSSNLSAYQSPEESFPLVVCIDDSPTVCTQMRQIIIDEDCRFVDIQNPITAIPQLLKIRPDLIFLDLVMPIVNGYELCAQIRRISIAKDIPIVILTGKDGLIDRVRSKMVGANDFVAKPVEQERILSILSKYALIN